MGTPNVNREYFITELAEILSRPEYTRLVEERATYLYGKDKNAYGVAKLAVKSAFGPLTAPKLLDPVIVTELVPKAYPIHLYRAFDGVAGAKTLGAWWCDRKLVKKSVEAGTANGKMDHDKTVKALTKSMFVHPSWNAGTDIARISIPVGARAPAIVGLGDWQAMLSTRHDKDAAGNDDPMRVESEHDLEKLGMTSMPGPKQYYLPVFDAMWVSKVPHLTDGWPYGK